MAQALTAPRPSRPVRGQSGNGGAQRVQHAGTTVFYYSRRTQSGHYVYVIVQLPTRATTTSAGSGGSLPGNIVDVVSRLGSGVLRAILAGGAAIGELARTAFPLLPLLLGAMLTALGVILRRRQVRFAT